MNLFQKLKNNVFWKSVVALSAGQIIAQVLNIITVPIASRIYGKVAYGDFGIVTSTATIIIGFIGMGLGSAIMSPKEDEESKLICRVTFSIQIFLSTVLCGIFWAISPVYKLFDTQLPYPIALLVMYLFINLTVLSSLLNVYINRKKLNKVLFINSLIGALSTLCITLPLGFAGLDMIGLYIANIISLVIINIHMLKNANPFKKMVTFKDIGFIIKKYKRFIIYQYPSNLVGTFTNQMPNQLISRNFGNTALGDYAMCNKVFGMPMSLIATPIQTVYFRTVSQKYQNGEDIAGFTYSLINKILLVSIIPAIILMSFGKTIFEFVLGEQWGVAGTLASILTLQYVFSFCYNCITYCRVVIDKQKINLFTSVFQTIIIIGSLFAGALIFKTLEGTITCFAVANLIYSVFNIAISFYCLRKNTLKFTLIAIAYCLICIVVSQLLKLLI